VIRKELIRINFGRIWRLAAALTRTLQPAWRLFGLFGHLVCASSAANAASPRVRRDASDSVTLWVA